MFLPSIPLTTFSKKIICIFISWLFFCSLAFSIDLEEKKRKIETALISHSPRLIVLSIMPSEQGAVASSQAINQTRVSPLPVEIWGQIFSHTSLNILSLLPYRLICSDCNLVINQLLSNTKEEHITGQWDEEFLQTYELFSQCEDIWKGKKLESREKIDMGGLIFDRATYRPAKKIRQLTNAAMAYLLEGLNDPYDFSLVPYSG